MGAELESVGVRDLPEFLSSACGNRWVAGVEPGRSKDPSEYLSVGEGAVRARLRTEPPAGLGADPASRHSPTSGLAGGGRSLNPKLAALARLYGIQTSYIDMAGRPHDAHPEKLLLVLRAMGAGINGVDDAPAALK